MKKLLYLYLLELECTFDDIFKGHKPTYSSLQLQNLIRHREEIIIHKSELQNLIRYRDYKLPVSSPPKADNYD